MNINPASMIKKRLENAISNSNYQDMVIALPVAVEYKVSPRIIKKVSQKIAEYYFEEKQFDQAAIYSNKARSIDPSIKKVFEFFCNSISEFFKTNIDEFSKKDLDEFKKTIIPVIDFHKFKFPSHHKSVDEMEDLFRRIDYRKKYTAKEKEETKVSYRIMQINNAITSDMTFEQIQSEFARIIEPTVRDLLNKKEQETKKVKRKESKKTKRKK